MDKKSWIGLLLIVAILFSWSYFTRPSEEAIAKENRRRDSIAQVQKEQALQEIVKKEQAEATQTPQINEQGKKKTSEVIEQEMNQAFGDFGKFALGKRKFYTLENELLKATFTNKGAKIYSVELKKYKKHDGSPLILFAGDSTLFGINFFSNNRSIETEELYFEPSDSSNSRLISANAESISFKLVLNDNKYIEFIYTISPNSYAVDFDMNFVNVNDLISANTGYLSLNWETYISSLEKGKKWETQNSTIFYKFHEDDIESLKSRSESGNENLTTPLKWISYKQQFFNSTLIAKNSFNNAIVKKEGNIADPNYIKKFSSEISLPYNGKPTESIPMQFYFGPNHYKTLKKMGLGLEKTITLGNNIIRLVNIWLVIPLFNFLGKYIASFGLIILIMTIIIKAIIFPFTYKSYMSSAKTKALKPEVDKISEKFPKPEDAMKKQRETMALYKKVGVSPMGGCLPLLFQMPFLLAMFRFFPNSIELRQQSFLWAKDLSTYDAVINLPFEVPFGFGDHISLFCLLMTIVNIIYMKFNDQMNGMGNQQMAAMKYMMYFMPIMMLFVFNNYASALSYYYFLSLLITIIQTWLIRRSVNDEEVLAKLKAAQANKKTPSKSKFQQRLEEMAKQRGIQPPKK